MGSAPPPPNNLGHGRLTPYNSDLGTALYNMHGKYTSTWSDEHSAWSFTMLLFQLAWPVNFIDFGYCNSVENFRFRSWIFDLMNISPSLSVCHGTKEEWLALSSKLELIDFNLVGLVIFKVMSWCGKRVPPWLYEVAVSLNFFIIAVCSTSSRLMVGVSLSLSF